MALPDGLIPDSGRIYTVPTDGSSSGTGDCGCGSSSPWWMRGLQPIIPSIATRSAIQLAAKSSADLIDYTLDFSAWFSDTSDTLYGTPLVTFPDASGSDYDLTDTFVEARDGTQVVFRLASGIPRTRQRVRVSIETQQGRTKVVDCAIRITNASDATLPPAAVQIPADATLNGRVYMVGATAPTLPLFSNGGVLMTEDADNPPAGSIANRTDPTSNIGVRMSAS